MFEASDDSGNFIGVYYEGGSVISIRVVKSIVETENGSTTEMAFVPTTTEISTIETTTTGATTTKPETTKPSTSTTIEPPVYCSTNTRKTVGNGNSGLYAYKNDGKYYDVYYIIDFDEGYVYNFSEGEGNTYCEKVKIVSGDLNSVMIITFSDGNDKWSYGLHFKYKNHPETLIVQDNDGFEIEYEPTDLETALKYKSTKNIYNY